MNITNKTILITGGGSGIGFEIASQLAVGRTQSKLKAAAEKIGNIDYFVGDINSTVDSLSLKDFLGMGISRCATACIRPSIT